MTVLDTFERAFIALNRWLLVLLLGAMSIIVFTNVCLRYLTNDSLVWAEEVARHMMIWLTFLGSGLALRYGAHIAIENLQNALPKPIARALRLLITLGLLVFFGAMIWFGLDYVERTMFQTTSATQIPFGYVYAAMPLGFAFMIVHLLLVARGFVLERGFDSNEDFDSSMSASL